jgi:hypothetical protein
MTAPATLRWRRHQARKKEGRSCYTILADQIGVELLLEYEGLLPATGTTGIDHQKTEVEAALARLIDLWIEQLINPPIE